MTRLFRWLAAVLMILVVAVAVLALTAAPRAPHPFLQNLPRGTLVLAHQGGDGLWPGNTLFAFERAVVLGADVLELDVHASLDGVLMVIHDDTVDRTTDGSGRVDALTLAQLRGLDAGYRWSPERTGESFPYRGRGIVIPTLQEVFDAFPETPVNIEIKPDDAGVAASLCDLIRAGGRQETVMVGSFHDAALRAFRRACPEVATSAGPNEVRTFFVLTSALLGSTFRPASEAFQVPEYQGSLHVVTGRFVAGARRKNVQVHVWTVDERDDIRRLLGLGVDGIITDRPDRALQLLGRGGEVDLPEGVPE